MTTALRSSTDDSVVVIAWTCSLVVASAGVFGRTVGTCAEPRYLHIAEPIAPSWLNTSGLRYRLAYRDPAEIRAYAQSRWVAPPALLIGRRPREAFAQRYHDTTRREQRRCAQGCSVRVTLNECSQAFDTPTSSRGVLSADAGLYGRDLMQPIMAQTFHQERVAASADARGSVHALTGAADALSDALLQWLAAH